MVRGLSYGETAVGQAQAARSFLATPPRLKGMGHHQILTKPGRDCTDFFDSE